MTDYVRFLAQKFKSGPEIERIWTIFWTTEEKICQFLDPDILVPRDWQNGSVSWAHTLQYGQESLYVFDLGYLYMLDWLCKK